MAQLRRLAGAALAASLMLVPVALPAMAKTKDVMATFNKLTIKRSYGKAAAVLLEAAQNGNAEAQFRLAGLYRLGLGVAQDDERALSWASESAAQGNADAIALLARWRAAPGRTKLDTPQTPDVTPPATAVSATGRNSLNQSWLFVAAGRGQEKAAAALAGGSSDINASDAGGMTPLMAAVASGSAATVAALLQAGADANAADARGRTALMMAASRQPALVGPLLEARARPDARDRNGHDALAHAAASCQAKSAALLAGVRSPAAASPPGETAAALAARNCAETGVLSALATAGALTDIDAAGRSALWYAAAAGQLPAATFLLEHGANPNVADANGLAALHVAAAFARPGLMRLLAAHGADAGLATNAGDTALHLAAAARCGACILALAPGQDLANAQNGAGDTALLIATRLGDADIVAALVKAGADASLRNKNRETARGIAKSRHLDRILAILP